MATQATRGLDGRRPDGSGMDRKDTAGEDRRDRDRYGGAWFGAARRGNAGESGTGRV